MVPDERPVDVRTYYDRPVLKAPVWQWYIPTYFFAGGLAAGSSMLAAGAMLTGDQAVARRARLVALPAIAAGSACLVADLGRPERFLNMLRVAKISSPMSTGTWVLTIYAPAAGLAALTDVLGGLPRTRALATMVAALTAPVIASYTAVLLSDTAIPAWHDARHVLPAVFVSSASGAAGGAALVAAALSGAPPSTAALRLAVGGTMCEALAATVMEHRLPPAVRKAYETGAARLLSRAAAGLGLGGAGAAVLGRRRRWVTAVGGAMVIAGSVCQRFAATAAGRASALDPRATVGPQRERADLARPAPAG